jgi:ribosome-associated toxin RatA of RatAB toxin-antitoxin module
VDTRIAQVIRAEPQTIFELAARVEDWPRLLPHYRWVRVLASDGTTRRTVEMAARRDVIRRLGVPLRWTAIETLYQEKTRIEFEHIRGITRGMQVAWTIERVPNDPQTVLVQIRHVFEPRWPAPEAVIRAVVGEYFVNGVARRTLAYVGELAERASAPTKRPS